MLPLLPLMVTCVAFAAVTVRVDELPDVIVPGLAAMVTVGVVVLLELFVKLAPHPANSRDKQRQKNASTAGRGERQVPPSRCVPLKIVSRAVPSGKENRRSRSYAGDDKGKARRYLGRC